MFSTRDDLTNNDQERGDILAKYDRDIHSQLKKMPGVNPILFQTVENWDSRQRAQGLRGIIVPEDDCGVDFENDSEDDESLESTEAEEREKKKQVEEAKRTAARVVKKVTVNEDDSIDIDAI